MTRANISTSHAPLVGTLVAFVVAAIGSVAFFAHFEQRRIEGEADGSGAGAGARPGRLRRLAGTAFGGEDDEDEDEGSAEQAREAVTPVETAATSDAGAAPPSLH